MSILQQINDKWVNKLSGENRSVAVRGIICLVFSIIAVIQLFTGCALQHHKGAGAWCVLIILGVLFQVFAIALFVINQLYIKIEDKQSDEEAQEKQDDNQIQINQSIVLINQALIFVIGFFYFLLGGIFMGSQTYYMYNSNRFIWLILVILGLIMTIGVSIVHIIYLPKYNQDLSLISIVLYPCLGLAFIFTGAKLWHDDLSDNYNYYHYRHFQIAWFLFILASYLFHSLSLLLLVIFSKRIMKIKILVINFVLGMIYSILGAIFGAVSQYRGGIWLFVSIPGILIIISSVLIVLSWQPFFKPIIRGFVIAFTNDNQKTVKKIHKKKKQTGLKLKKKTLYTAL